MFISTAFAGLFSGSRLLTFAEVWLKGIDTQGKLGMATVVTPIISNVFGCTQTIAILMTGQLMQPHYQRYYQPGDATFSEDAADEQLALALEDTAVVIAPLIPWNIAGLIPATALGVGAGFIPYAAYLFLLPLFWLIKESPLRGRSLHALLAVSAKR